MKSSFPIVIIEADDWSHYSLMHDPRTQEFSVEPLLVCGWLIESTKKHVVVALEQDGEGKVRDANVIPQSCIKRMQKIHVPTGWRA